MEISEVGLNALKKAAESKKGKEFYKKFKITFDIYWGRTLGKYHHKVSDYLSSIKTLIYRHRPVDFYSVFIETSVSSVASGGTKGPEVSTEELFEALNKNCRLVISGIAGSGKSMLVLGHGCSTVGSILEAEYRVSPSALSDLRSRMCQIKPIRFN